MIITLLINDNYNSNNDKRLPSATTTIIHCRRRRCHRRLSKKSQLKAVKHRLTNELFLFLSLTLFLPHPPSTPTNFLLLS